MWHLHIWQGIVRLTYTGHSNNSVFLGGFSAMSNTANWPLAMSVTKACQTISGLVKTRGHLIMLRHAIGWNLRVCLLWLTGMEFSIVNDMTVVLRKFWAALGRRRTITEMNNGVSKMGPPVTLPLTLYCGEGSDSRIDSSVRVTLSRHHTHPIYPPPPPPSPLDVYLWGYLKDRVYKNNPQTIGDLKTAFTASIRAIPIEEGVRITDNFVLRLQACQQRQAGHLEHSLEGT